MRERSIYKKHIKPDTMIGRNLNCLESALTKVGYEFTSREFGNYAREYGVDDKSVRNLNIVGQFLKTRRDVIQVSTKTWYKVTPPPQTNLLDRAGVTDQPVTNKPEAPREPLSRVTADESISRMVSYYGAEKVAQAAAMWLTTQNYKVMKPVVKTEWVELNEIDNQNK